MSEEKLKILIIRLSSIGDILLATPFIRQVRQKFSNAKIDFLIRLEFESLLLKNPNIDNLISFDINTGLNGLIKLRKHLISNNYQYVLDLHNNPRSIFIRFGIKTKNKNVIIKNKFIQALLVYFKINKYDGIVSIHERYSQVGRPFGIKDDGKGLELYWEQDISKATSSVLENEGLKQNEQYFTVAPGAGFFTKKWPIEYYMKLVSNLVKKYNKKIVILGSSSEISEGEELSKISNVINLTGKLSLLQTAQTIAMSGGLISNDSGLMHMATAVNVPVLAIFGSTVEEFGFFPFRSKSVVVENNKINCRPCSHIGRNKCPKKHFRCMKEIYPEIVVEKFEELLKL